MAPIMGIVATMPPPVSDTKSVKRFAVSKVELSLPK